MYQLGPEFIDVTWGAGGTTSEVTLEICATAQAVYGLETCMHLTCTNMPREKIDNALKVYINISLFLNITYLEIHGIVSYFTIFFPFNVS